MNFDPAFCNSRSVGFETAKSYKRRYDTGFWQRYLTGPNVIDIGYRGGVPNALPLFENCIGIELGTYGYDGLHLPCPDEWADAIHASHVLEHLDNRELYLQEWLRALKVGGHLLIFVPSAFLYERRFTVPPSRWSPEHVTSYSPSTLLLEVELALIPNTYRVRHLADNDTGYDYSLPLDVHPTGCLEIELVLQKIEPPAWDVEP
jgi:SAM-dependent methyltransferase